MTAMAAFGDCHLLSIEPFGNTYEFRQILYRIEYY